MKKRNWLAVILGAVIILAVVVLVPRVYRGVKLWQMGQQIFGKSSMSTDLRLEGADLRLDWRDTEQGRIYILQAGEIPIYFSGTTFYLENGKGYDFDHAFASLERLLGSPWKLMGLVQIRKDAGIWTAELEEYQLTLEQQEDGFSRLQFQGDGMAVELIPRGDRTALEVPGAVLDSISTGKTQGGDLTEEVLALVSAWVEFSGRTVTETELTLVADCGILSLNQSVTLLVDRETGIGTVGTLYFKDNRICTADGTLYTGKEFNVEAVHLVGLAYQLLLSGDFTVEDELYRLRLDQQGMERFAYGILPEAEGLAIAFTSGEVCIGLEDGKLKSLAVTCGGNLDLLLTEVEVSLGIGAEMKERSEGFEIPQSVREALITN